jgi:mRNA interferase HicA
VNSAEFKRWLEKLGCTFESGKGGHLKVRLGKRFTVLPMHGSGKEIGKGLENRIKRDLGLK